MAIELGNYDERAVEAVKTFWATHLATNEPQGDRAPAPDSESMVGFEDLITEVVLANGLAEASILLGRRVCGVPAHFWATNAWDMLVVNSGRLVAAIELQSHVGPTCERTLRGIANEAIAGGVDLWAAYRVDALGDGAPHPFVGWLMLLEDSEESRSPVIDAEPNFPVFPEFDRTSYAQRCESLCRKLAQERLYTAACLLVSPHAAARTGQYSTVSDASSLRNFVLHLARRIAVEAAMSQSSP